MVKNLGLLLLWVFFVCLLVRFIFLWPSKTDFYIDVTVSDNMDISQTITGRKEGSLFSQQIIRMCYENMRYEKSSSGSHELGKDESGVKMNNFGEECATILLD